MKIIETPVEQKVDGSSVFTGFLLLSFGCIAYIALAWGRLPGGAGVRSGVESYAAINSYAGEWLLRKSRALHPRICFVWVPSTMSMILGFYTVASSLAVLGLTLMVFLAVKNRK